jgi:hypothetical protein
MKASFLVVFRMSTVSSRVPQACPLPNVPQWNMWNKLADFIKSDIMNTQSSDTCNSKAVLHDRYVYDIWSMACAISVNIWIMRTRSHFGKLIVYTKIYSPSEHLGVGEVTVLFNWRVAFHLLDVTILNSYLILAFCDSKREQWTFQLILVQNLLDMDATKPSSQSSPKGRPNLQASLRTHTDTGHSSAAGSHFRSHMCSDKNKQTCTTFMCLSVGFCVYHTKVNFQSINTTWEGKHLQKCKRCTLQITYIFGFISGIHKLSLKPFS